MNEPWPFRRHAPLTERWWWLSWDQEVEARQHLLTHLDGAAIALEQLISGRPVPEEILFVRMDPPRAQATTPEYVADEVRAAIASGAVADARMSALIWLLKYAHIGSPRPMTRLYPDRRERRTAFGGLRRLRPPLFDVLPPEDARAAWAVLEVVRPVPGSFG